MSLGSKIVKRGGEFVAYSVEVQELQQVKDAYVRVRKLHPSDANVMCACRLADLNDPLLHDCVDDGEPGGTLTSHKQDLQYAICMHQMKMSQTFLSKCLKFLTNLTFLKR